MTLRKENGKLTLEAAATTPRKIDLTGIAGAMPWLEPLTREEREFDDSPRD